MLQHNASGVELGAGPQAVGRPSARHNAHVAHAIMVGMHSLCCGLPIVALMLTAASGAAFGTAAFYHLASSVHHVLHKHEIWILAGSVALVSIGGFLEWRAHRRGHSHGFPWMFAVSLFCLAANIAILILHRAT